MLDSSYERSERILREELSRNREESAHAAKSQREELTKSLESVRGIVDLRLKELHEDNTNHKTFVKNRCNMKFQSVKEN